MSKQPLGVLREEDFESEVHQVYTVSPRPTWAAHSPVLTQLKQANKPGQLELCWWMSDKQMRTLPWEMVA